MAMFLKLKLLNNASTILQFSSMEHVPKTAEFYKPLPVQDYFEGSSTPMLKMKCLFQLPSKPSGLIYIFYLYFVDKKTSNMTHEKCEACEVNSDSLFPHFERANCLDDTIDFIYP